MMLIVTREHVLQSGIAQASYAQAVVEETFHQKLAGTAHIAQEISMIPSRVEKGAFYSLPAYLGEKSVAGIKWTTHVRGTDKNVPYTHPLIVLNDFDTGQPTALVEGLLISGLRTGAVSATAVKYLTNANATSLLVCGSGFQAEHQVRAVIPFLPQLMELHLWSRTEKHAELFAEKLADTLAERNIQVRIHRELPKTLDFAQVVIGATSATESYLHADQFSAGQLFINIGMRDIDVDSIAQFDRIICDDFKSGLLTSSQSLFNLARKNDQLEQKVTLLEDIITNKVQLTQTQAANEKWMFNGFGLPIFDLALAHAVVGRVQELSLSAPIIDMYGEG